MNLQSILGVVIALGWAGCASGSPAQEGPSSPSTPPVNQPLDQDTWSGDGPSVVEKIAAGDAAWLDARLGRSVAGKTNGDDLVKAWNKLEEHYGGFVRVADSTKRDRGTAAWVMEVLFDSALIQIHVVVSKANRIVHIALGHEWTPPAYATRSTYREHLVTVGDAPWELPGVLTIPREAKSVPGIVLVHGSGPQNRDETVGPNKLFRDLAYGLASRGLAVLRFDKRTLVHAATLIGDVELARNLTMTQETVADAIAGVALLRKHPLVDPARVFVLGHSQGGYMAPRMVEDDPAIAGVVVLAGNTTPLQVALPRQLKYIAKHQQRELSAREKKLIEECERIAALDPNNPPDKDARFFQGTYANYWLDLVNYRPAAMTKKQQTPYFFLQGERDYQVTVEHDLATWKKALRRRRNVTFKTYPRLNHFFMAGEGPGRPSEYRDARHASEQVIDDIANWVVNAKPATGP